MGVAKTVVGIARRLFDGWENLTTGLGVEGKDHRTETTYASRPELSRPTIDAMYEQDALIARMIDTIPDDGTRRWIKPIAQGDTDWAKQVIDWLDQLGARDVFADWWAQGDLYGGALLIPIIEDGQAPDQPLNIEAIKSIDGLTVITKWDCGAVEYDQNPFSKTYGDRLSFMLQNGQRLHASRCFVYTTPVASTRRLIDRGGWGPSKLERVIESLRRYGSIWGYVEGMFKDVTQGVFRIQGANEIMLAEDGPSRMLIRLRAMAFGASAYRAIVVDKDTEDYERREASFAGIDNPIKLAMDDLAGVSGMPLTKLFGQAPGGLSTDDASGMRNYYDQVASRQRRVLRSPIETLIEMGMAAGLIPQVEDWHLAFEPLEEPNETQEAERANKQALTDHTLIADGVISEKEARSRLINDPESPYSLEGEEPPEPEVSPQDQALLLAGRKQVPQIGTGQPPEDA